VILGVTELTLILKPDDIRLGYVDTAAIRTTKIVELFRGD
jgi:aspartate/glutamate racemase